MSASKTCVYFLFKIIDIIIKKGCHMFVWSYYCNFNLGIYLHKGLRYTCNYNIHTLFPVVTYLFILGYT